MSAQFTEVTLEDMENFLKRGFRALRPLKGAKSGEVYYDLKVGPFVGIRVWTSIHPRSGVGAEVGSDAIRVQLVSLKDQGPLEKGKAPIVKRTQGWRNSLQDKIEELVEKYEDNEDFWEEWAEHRRRGGDAKKEEVKQEPPAVQEEVVKEEVPTYQRTPYPMHGDISEKQLGFIRGLLKGKSHSEWVSLGLSDVTGFNSIPNNAQLQSLSKRQAGQVIDILLKARGGRRYSAEQLESDQLELDVE